MNNKMKKSAALLAAILSAALLFASGFAMTACGETKLPISKAVMIVCGCEWGPGISRVVVEFTDNVTGADKDTFEADLNDRAVAVNDVYVSDANGQAADASEYLTLCLDTKPDLPSPLQPDPSGSEHNVWTNSVNLTLSLRNGKTLTVGDRTVEKGSLSYEMKTADRLSPDTDVFAKDSFTYKSGAKDITLTRGAFEPDGAAEDSGKNPLVIWLHGLGEGGTDIDIALLGNEVTALSKPVIQKYFANDTLDGAYVLAVQCPTMWADGDGSGTTPNYEVSDGKEQTSYYTEALMAAIEDYVQSNPDIDTDRIYLGGCSNGGYMTLNLMYDYGDYFAAYFPICEGYNNRNISNAMIERTKDCRVWFLQSDDDTTLPPRKSTLPTFYRYLAAGAENMFLTLKENVVGKNGDGYLGHFSWIYAFNDDVRTRFDNERVAADLPNVTIRENGTLSDYADIYLRPANCDVACNMWEWLAACRK